MTRFPELERLRTTVEDDVKQRHLDAISAAIAEQRRPRMRRLRLLAVATAIVLLLPVIALAAEDSVPGDLLYPFKVFVEPVVGIFDEDVVIDHRVEEVETLHERDAEPERIRDHADRAFEVVTDEHPEHRDRLEHVVDQLDDDARPATDGTTDQRTDPEPDPSPTDEPDSGGQVGDRDSPTNGETDGQTDTAPSDQTEQQTNPGDHETTTTAPHDSAPVDDRVRDG